MPNICGLRLVADIFVINLGPIYEKIIMDIMRLNHLQLSNFKFFWKVKTGCKFSQDKNQNMIF